MLKSELLEIITNGKNSGVEFKRDDILQEKLAKEVAAAVGTGKDTEFVVKHDYLQNVLIDHYE